MNLSGQQLEKQKQTQSFNNLSANVANQIQLITIKKSIPHQTQQLTRNMVQPQEQSIQKKRKKSYSPVKSLRMMQNTMKPNEQFIQRPPVLISSFSPQQPQTTKLVASLRNSATYLLQNQISRNPSLSNKRSQQEIQLIMKLIGGNKLWKDLGYEQLNRSSDNINFQQMLKQICGSIVLLWSQIPSITQTKSNQVYLILQGKTFEYIHNESAAIKLKIHQNNDYIMIKKLIQNDYFVTLTPQLNKSKSKFNSSSQKYQLMVDQKTLMGKISEEIYNKWIHKKLLQRIRYLTSFMKKIVLFQNLPDIVFHQLSKFIVNKKINPNTQIINVNQKSKDIYFIKKGDVEFKLIATSLNQSKSQDTKTQILKQFDVFGMDTLHTVKAADITVQYAAQSLTQCQLYCIDKRILAIVISSFQKEFKTKESAIKPININSQIKGQNYLSQKQQLLSKNAERIKTTQKRIRDVKLQSFSRKNKRQVNTYIPEKDRVIEDRKVQARSTETKFRGSGGFNLIRNKSLKSQGSLLNPRDSTDSMFWTLKNKYQKKYQIKTGENDGSNYNNYVMPVMEQQEDMTLKLRKTLLTNSSYHQFQRINKKSLHIFSPNSRGKSFDQVNNDSYKRQYAATTMSSFIPKIQSKSSFFQSSSNTGKVESDIIKNHIQKKIKNELIRKAQQVLQRKASTQRNVIKSIKKFYNVESFSPSKNVPQIVMAQNRSRKQLTDDLFDRMANIREYPLLSLIESQRKKMQSLSKVNSKQLKQIKQKREQIRNNNRKIKINEKKILILNSQTLNDVSNGQQPLNRFSSSGSRILTQQV